MPPFLASPPFPFFPSLLLSFLPSSETRARANFNNGNFRAVINEFAECVLLEMIMERAEEMGRDTAKIREGGL